MNSIFNQNSEQETSDVLNAQKRRESSAINKAAWVIALSGAVFYLASTYISDIIIYFGNALGITSEKLAEVFGDPVSTELLQIALSMLLLLVPFTLFCKLFGGRVSDLIGFNMPDRENRGAYLLMGVGFCAFANVAVYYAGQLFEKFGFNSNQGTSAKADGIYGFLIAVIATAVVPAVVEEYAFRGIVLGLLRPLGEAFSILASAVAFGLLHGNFEQIPFAFLVGLILGYIRIKSGSILICIIVHMINNLISVLLSYATFMPSTVISIAYNAYIVLALIGAVVGVALLKSKNELRFNAPQRALTAKETYVMFFLSPATVIFSAMFLYKATTYIVLN